MKKVLAITMAVMMALSLVACGGSASAPAETAAAKAETAAAAKAEVKEEAKTEAAEASSDLPAMDPITIKYAMSYAADHPHAIIFGELCDEIKERTNGAITVDLYVANTIGSEQEITDMVRTGDLFGGSIGAQMFENYVPGFAAWRLPFAVDSCENFVKFFDEYAKDELFNPIMIEQQRVRAISMASGGARHLSTKGVEVHKPDDLKGVKIRSMEQPVSISFIEALGGNPIPIAWSELYMALQTGTAQGQENPLGNIVSSKFYEVQDYVMLTGHSAGGGCVICVNEDAFQALPKEYQDIIVDVLTKGSKRITEEVASMEQDYIKTLKDNNVTVIGKEDLDMDAFKANAKAVIEKNFSSDAEMREQYKIMEDWIAANCK